MCTHQSQKKWILISFSYRSCNTYVFFITADPVSWIHALSGKKRLPPVNILNIFLKQLANIRDNRSEQ